MIDNQDMDRQALIHKQVMEILGEQLNFSNVARPKPTKASTATSAAWKKAEEPKASAATQGSWDSTDTPGGVSSLAKEKWTVKEIAAMVTKVLCENRVAFSNKPLPAPTTISSSTQPAWKKEEEGVRKPAAGTQGAWDTTDSPGGVSSEAKQVWNPEAIAAMVTKVLKRNHIAFSNKPLPAPTTISSSTQPAWKKEEEGVRKPAAGTQGAWDTTDSPGGVSTEAKQVWNPDAIAAMVTKALKEHAEFHNMPLPKPTTVSSSTQAAWKGDEEECHKISASTQAVWKKDEPRKPSASTQAGWK